MGCGVSKAAQSTAVVRWVCCYRRGSSCARFFGCAAMQYRYAVLCQKEATKRAPYQPASVKFIQLSQSAPCLRLSARSKRFASRNRTTESPPKVTVKARDLITVANSTASTSETTMTTPDAIVLMLYLRAGGSFAIRNGAVLLAHSAISSLLIRATETAIKGMKRAPIINSSFVISEHCSANCRR